MTLVLLKLALSIIVGAIQLLALIVDTCIVVYDAFFGEFDKIAVRERVAIKYADWLDTVRHFYQDLWLGDHTRDDFMQER